MVICPIFLCQICLASVIFYSEYSFNVNDSELINEFTWAIIRGDFSVESKFGTIKVPKPSEGTVLIPGNMMSEYVCKVAISIYNEDKMKTLEALENYAVDNMIHCDPAFIKDYNEWNSPTIENYRKNSADEMAILGQICLKGNIIGDCYSQTCLITSILRLCGFPPEEIFTILITGHALNIVKINEKWYIFDSNFARSVKYGFRDTLILESYEPSLPKRIFGLENDKYYVNFGNANDHFYDPYSNMNPELLIEIANIIAPMFNDSKFSHWEWDLKDIDDFIDEAIPIPEMKKIEVPYSVEDAQGSTIEEKTESLKQMITSFIIDQTNDEIPNQYDRSLYVMGFSSVDYPQAYANAAKYAGWTSFFGESLDSSTPKFDYLKTVIWIRSLTLNRQIMPYGCVAFSDLPYIRHAGSSIDQAIMAYGTLRNMHKDSDFWQPEDLFVLITEDDIGYLTVNIDDNWYYLNFENGSLVTKDKPNNIILAFNEEIKMDEWF
jgi:hypothetical protein